MLIIYCLIYTYIILWDLYCFDSRTTADMTKTCCSQNDLRCNASLEAITSDRLYREFTWSVSQMLLDQNNFDLIFILQFFLNPKTPVDLQGPRPYHPLYILIY